MINFKRLFPVRTWEKGLHYYETQKITKFQGKGNTFSAVVSGSNNYRVSIILADDKVSWMSCSCPHAQSSNNCKHMAAVLCKIQNEFATSDTKKAKNAEAQAIFKKYLNRNGSISIYHEKLLYADLNRYLTELEINSHNDNDTITQLKYMCKQLDLLIMQNSELKLTMASRFANLLVICAKNAKYEKQLKSWVKKQCLEVSSTELAKAYVQILMPTYDYDHYVEMNQLITDNIHNRIITSVLLEEKIKLMRAIKKTENAIYEEIKRYENYEVVFDFLLSYYENQKLYVECSKLIARLLNKGNLSVALRNKYVDKLNSIAFLAKDKKAYGYVVKRQLQSWQETKDEKILMNYRSMFDNKEWEGKKSFFFREWYQMLNVERYLNALIYLSEYKCVFAFLFENIGKYRIDHYAEYLSVFDEEALVQLFFEIMEYELNEVTNKGQYTAIIEHLKFISTLQDGKLYTDDLIMYLKQNYMRKRSLMEKLNKFEQEMDEC